MIMIETLSKREIKIDEKEVLRYLGYGKNQADEMVLKKIDSMAKKMQESIFCKVCYEKYPLILMDDMICFGSIQTTSADLKKNLSGCTDVMVFVATIGIEADRIIGKNSLLSTVDAVIAQAVGTTLIESWCDIFCEKISKTENKFLHPRFSPGYGDFGIENQKEIFKMLDVTRKIGVSLADSLQMVPSKSVSAIVGIGGEEHTEENCQICDNINCPYRRK